MVANKLGAYLAGMESPTAEIGALAYSADVFFLIIDRSDTASVTDNPNTVAVSIV
jgi:hypothetical protein